MQKVGEIGFRLLEQIYYIHDTTIEKLRNIAIKENKNIKN